MKKLPIWSEPRWPLDSVMPPRGRTTVTARKMSTGYARRAPRIMCLRSRWHMMRDLSTGPALHDSYRQPHHRVEHGRRELDRRPRDGSHGSPGH
jgi:hypothetical protein